MPQYTNKSAKNEKYHFSHDYVSIYNALNEPRQPHNYADGKLVLSEKFTAMWYY